MKTAGRSRIPVKILTVTALFTAMNVAVSSFGIPVPGGHFYLSDVIVCTAALLLNPFCAFVAGGVGAFLGDLIFYPAPMFVSLVTHGLQAVVISLIAHSSFGGKNANSSAYHAVKTVSSTGGSAVDGSDSGKVRRLYSNPSLSGSIIGVALGAVIMIAGYTFGRAFIYSTPEYSIMKLPYEILQAAVGAVVSIIIVFPLRIRILYRRIIGY